jgi:hypothetical protein
MLRVPLAVAAVAALALAVPPAASAQDTTPPVSTMTTIGNGPNADGWSMGNRQFTIDATDDGGAANVEKIVYEVIATGANALPPTTHLGFRANFQVRFEGYYTLRWYAVDKAGNVEEPQQASYKHDSSSPRITDERFQGSSFLGWFRDSVTITATATDPILQDGNAPSGIRTVNWPRTVSTTGLHEPQLVAEDVAGHHGFLNVRVRVDADAPQVSLTGCPTEPVLAGTQVGVSVAATDVGSGLAADPSGTYALATDVAGVHERVFTARDVVQHETSASCTYEVLAPFYAFDGFFRPVSMTDVNAINAGRAVPVTFTLGGDQGLDVIEPGSPRTVEIPCDSIDSVGTVEPTSTAGSSSLQYDPVADQYTYVWKTDSAWAGQCRQFVLQLDDGSTHRAYFRFR